MGHVTLNTSLVGWSVIRKLALDVVYQCASFDNSSYSCSRYIIVAPKFKIGHMTLTMPLLREICHP